MKNIFIILFLFLSLRLMGQNQVHTFGSTTDNLKINDLGQLTTTGEANRVAEYTIYGYNVYPSTATYNGQTCTATTPATLSNQWYYQGFSPTNNNENAFFFNYHLAGNYVAGGQLMVHYHVTTSNTTSTDSSVYYIGVLAVAAGADMTATPTWFRTVAPCPSVAFYDIEAEIDVTSINANPHDVLTVIIYREPDDATDNNGSTSYINIVIVSYEINKIGAVKE